MNLSSLDLKLLRTFIAIVEEGGFTAAQHRLGLSASSISSQVRALEDRLGFRLCTRGRSGFSLTEEGRRVHLECDRLFAALDGFSSAVGDLKGQLSGTLRLALVDNIVTNPGSCLPQALARFQSRNSDVELRLDIRSPAGVEAALLRGEVELGISATHQPLEELRYQELFEENLDLFVGDKHPLYAVPDEQLSLQDLQPLDLVARRAVSQPSPFAQVAQPHRRAVTDQMEGALHLILSGFFIGYLPQHYAREWLLQGKLRQVRLVGMDLSYHSQFYLITHLRRRPSLALSCFCQDLLDAH
ncbi:LysR family transcriptional regulator [Rhodovibrionaceae bacterium A322]